jgi:hypothetical protein
VDEAALSEIMNSSTFEEARFKWNLRMLERDIQYQAKRKEGDQAVEEAKQSFLERHKELYIAWNYD